VATYKIRDRADEYRIEIIGRFAGSAVQEVQQCWEDALREATTRRLILDLSRLSGYDHNGRKVLAAMYHHGTEMAARTPSSLVFLNEIANTPRKPAALLTAATQAPQRTTVQPHLHAIAAGQ
jgi:hypothetical protein